jgi:hypothetical protein
MESHNDLPPGLSVETRKGRLYLYARVRVGGRLYAQYVGPVDPQTAAELVVRAGVERDRRRWAVRHVREDIAAALAAGAAFDALADHLTRTAMHLGGYHQHRRGEWRRCRTETTPLIEDDDDDDDDLNAPPPRPALVAVSSPDPEIRAVLARAARGDATALPRVRELLAQPGFARGVGDVADFAREELVGKLAGSNLAVAEGVRRKVAEVEAGFLADCGPTPTFAESVAAGRAANAWLTVHHLEVLLARQKPGTPGQLAIEKAVGRADRRLQAALKGLAVLRRLRGPAVRVTQVNVAGAETVVVG